MHVVIPLLGETNDCKPRPVGSAVLLEIAGKHFLLTAAHVLDENDITPLYLPGKNGFVALHGNSKRTAAPEGGRDLDRYDLDYVELPENVIESIPVPYWFLPIQLVGVDCVPTQGQHFIFTGYPHKSVAAKYGTTKVHAQIESYTDQVCPPSLIQKAEADPNFHIVIHFDRKRAMNSDGRVVTPKERKGMSGGGVWTGTPGLSPNGLPNLRLCGITIEHGKKNQCMVATRIVGVLEMIRRDFPQLSSAIPRSKTLAVNCNERDESANWIAPTIGHNTAQAPILN